MKFVLCFMIVALAATVKAQDSRDDLGLFADYWSNEFEYDEYAEQNNKDSEEKLEAKAGDTSKQLDDELLNFKENPQEDVENKEDPFDLLDDYQFEDNRSNADDKDVFKDSDNAPNEEPIPDDAPEGLDNMDESPLEPLKEENVLSDESWENLFNDDDAQPSKSGEWVNLLKDEIAVEPEKDKEAFDEYPHTVNEGDDNLDDLLAESLSNELAEQDHFEQSDLDSVLEETNKLLKESDDNFSEDDTGDDKEGANINLESKVDETPEDVLNDLNDDLDKLLETLDKLSDNDSDLDNKDENVEKVDNIDDVQDYEEKYNRPYKEGNILSLRDDIENFDDNLPDIFAENAENDDAKDKESINESSFEDEIADIVDDNNETTTTKVAEQVENSDILDKVEDDSNEFDYSSEIDKLLSYVDNLSSDETANSDIKHSYGNDGLEDDQQPFNEDAEIISVSGGSLATDTTTENIVQNATTEESPSTKLVDKFNSSEYNELMAQFAYAHNQDLDVKSEDFVKSVVPIHITLSVDEPTVITSPNYPDLYPTDNHNIVDWIIEGPGTGIEMNMTHLALNGPLGDYLLVTPGGIDASSTDGLVFSFRLITERRYRFTNVNRMFVRFESYPGPQFFDGFSFSARMIWPPPEITPEHVPEPEAVLHPPEETLVLNLAGLTLREFEEVKPLFKGLVADMALEYIKDIGIDPGLNTTAEVTQITRMAICNIRWPSYETCVEVTIGVPLHYDEQPENPRLNTEDLDAMWRTYISKEPFATRLKEMGITEYAIPNDRTVLMVWLVISAGVVISMAMLAFALWRFSCFEDYTRMRTYSDNDSIQNEKKNLDLYPTPHQTLPPLYSETDYKWADNNDATRVDMGGFANKSFMRDNLFEFDSDEDIITPHDRRGTPISPRDVYEV